MIFGAIAGLLGNIITAGIQSKTQKAIADKQGAVSLAGQQAERADNAQKLAQTAVNTQLDTMGLSAANQQRAIEDLVEGYRQTFLRGPGPQGGGFG